MLLRPDNEGKISALREFVPSITSDIKFNTIANLVRTCEDKYIKPVIGEDLYLDLDTNFASLTGTKKEVLVRVQASLANFVAYEYASQNIALIGSRGHQEESSDDNLELLLNYINIHKADLPAWESELFESTHQNFINSYKEFFDACEIHISVLTYLQLKRFIKESQLYSIEPLLGSALFEAYLDNIKNQALSTDAKTALVFIQKILAYTTIKRGLPFFNCKVGQNGLEILLTNDGLTNKIKATDEFKNSFLAQLEHFISNNKARLVNYIKVNPASFAEYIDQEAQDIFITSTCGGVAMI
jgi:hypothetical protein